MVLNAYIEKSLKDLGRAVKGAILLHYFDQLVYNVTQWENFCDTFFWNVLYMVNCDIFRIFKKLNNEMCKKFVSWVKLFLYTLVLFIYDNFTMALIY